MMLKVSPTWKLATMVIPKQETAPMPIDKQFSFVNFVFLSILKNCTHLYLITIPVKPTKYIVCTYPELVKNLPQFQELSTYYE